MSDYSMQVTQSVVLTSDHC